MPYPDSNKTAIYVLVDPVTDAVRYVGRASRPDSRLYYHIYSSCRAQEDQCDARMLWIRGLVASGLAPIMRVVSETDAESASALESQTALQHLREGADLTNDLSTFGLIPRMIRPYPQTDPDMDYDTARDIADDAIREQSIPDDPGWEHQPF